MSLSFLVRNIDGGSALVNNALMGFRMNNFHVSSEIYFRTDYMEVIASILKLIRLQHEILHSGPYRCINN